MTLTAFFVTAAVAVSIPSAGRAEKTPPAGAATPAAEVDKLRGEAFAALGRGQWTEAREKFEAVLARRPSDGEAQREAARAAQAAGDFEYAVAALERAHHLMGHGSDAEVHYLRGEALYALGRVDEARQEHRIAELEIRSPTERYPMLWLARIHARRGNKERAASIYETMWPTPGQPADAEVAMSYAEAYTLNSDWAGAEKVLRRLLAQEPDHSRARHMLAWALESQGQLKDELAVRAKLAADEATVLAHKDYGRVLERAGDFQGALAAYRRAQSFDSGLTDETLHRSVDRLRYRTSPELGGGLMARSDPAATSFHLQAAAALPLVERLHLALLAARETVRGGFPVGGGATTLLSTTLVASPRWGGSLSLGGGLRYVGDVTADSGVPVRPARGVRGGAAATAEVPIGPFFQVDARADYNNLWSESSITTQEGGAVTGLTAQVYGFALAKRLIAHVGAQGRQLTLAPGDPRDPAPAAEQLLMFGGVDGVLWSDAGKILRGESMDDAMIRRSYLADSIVLSYRHYELYTRADADFLGRIGLAERSSINGGQVVVRKALGGGRFGLDTRAGLGYDDKRGRRILYQGGATLLFVPTGATRIAASYDHAAETTTGLSGRRHTAWLTYHADL